ncbi:palmitoyltransferase swf1 [Coemansia sp. RSA 1822]|nr:palmitoyltransferase swf1 [Coemansia sp. RSA 638]KAJ2539938.1 palmitoyltransferase swf1 [Coemansia sp. RSA 1853]KAJ2565092.1 palmitoyltransferase swf1 [Coemansia sp. RSA 1822]
MSMWSFTVFWALAALGVFGLWVTLLILGPNRMFRGTAVERAYFAVTETLPEALERWMRSGVGDALAARAERAWNALFGRRNPMFQIFGVVLYWTGLAVFFVQVAPYIPNRYAASWQWVPIGATLAANIGSYIAACAADPGVVSAENVDAACQVFGYDHLLYFERDCRTCLQCKPARSKHCSACQRCVQMMDHHCIWLNNCVGLGNARWFLCFLATFSIVCVYGTYLVGTVILELRHVHGLADGAVIWDELGRPVQLSFKSSVLYLFDGYPLLAVLFVLLLVLTPAIGIFTAYQLRITALGYTSNEETKWLNISDAVKDGVVFAVRDHEDTPHETIQVIEKEDQADDARPRRPISHLRHVPNMYDRGPWLNLKFVLFPPRPESVPKAHQS